MRIKVADKGLLDADAWSAVSDTLDGFKTNIQRILTRVALGDGDEEVEAVLIPLAATWRKRKAAAEARDSRRSRLEEDPHRIPEMAAAEYGQMRANFVRAHPDTLLTEHSSGHSQLSC